MPASHKEGNRNVEEVVQSLVYSLVNPSSFHQVHVALHHALHKAGEGNLALPAKLPLSLRRIAMKEVNFGRAKVFWAVELIAIRWC